MRCESDFKNCPTDIYRHSVLRNLGYLGPLSIFLTPVIPLSVARMACASYIMWDVYDKQPRCGLKDEYERNALANTGDVLLFHLVSSLLVPGIVLKSLKGRIGKIAPKSPTATRLIPGFLFLATIPFLGKFVDSGTNYVMNNSYRKWLGITPYEKEKILRKIRLGQISDEFDNIQSRDLTYELSTDKNGKNDKNKGKLRVEDSGKGDGSINKKPIKESPANSKDQSRGDFKDDKSNEQAVEETPKVGGNVRSREKGPGEVSRMV